MAVHVVQVESLAGQLRKRVALRLSQLRKGGAAAAESINPRLDSESITSFLPNQLEYKLDLAWSGVGAESLSAN